MLDWVEVVLVVVVRRVLVLRRQRQGEEYSGEEYDKLFHCAIMLLNSLFTSVFVYLFDTLECAFHLFELSLPDICRSSLMGLEAGMV